MTLLSSRPEPRDPSTSNAQTGGTGEPVDLPPEDPGAAVQLFVSA